jgi:hypothetical protein
LFLSDFPVHESFLPADECHSPESTAASRHCESTPPKLARKPPSDDLAQVAGHKGNDSDAVGRHHFV